MSHGEEQDLLVQDTYFGSYTGKEIGSKKEEPSSAKSARGYVRKQQEAYPLCWFFYLLTIQSFLLGVGFSQIYRDS